MGHAKSDITTDNGTNVAYVQAESVCLIFHPVLLLLCGLFPMLKSIITLVSFPKKCGRFREEF